MKTGQVALEKPDQLILPRVSAAAGSGAPGGAPRYGFVDLLRGFALLVMIETHVVNAYLPQAARSNPLFFWLSFVNGLVAPSFLFASGFSVVLQARRRWEDWLRIGPAFGKQMRRLGFILLVAYYIHLPHFGISRFLVEKDQAFWKRALQVDVLQCIVVSLLVVNVLILLTRRPSVFFWVAAAIAAGAALATPWMWAQDFTGRVPLALALFLNPQGVSLFPLFPWISFLLAGSCVAHLFLNAVAGKTDSRMMRWMLIAGVGAIAAGLAGRAVPWLSAWNVGFYRTSPLYVLIRLGCVLILCAGLYLMEKRLGWVPHAIRLAGQESLLVYSMHLLLIFSVLRGKTIAALLGREAGLGVCFLMSAAIVVLMIWMAGLWHGWKRTRPRRARMALAAFCAANAVIFLLQ